MGRCNRFFVVRFLFHSCFHFDSFLFLIAPRTLVSTKQAFVFRIGWRLVLVSFLFFFVWAERGKNVDNRNQLKSVYVITIAQKARVIALVIMTKPQNL